MPVSVNKSDLFISYRNIRTQQDHTILQEDLQKLEIWTKDWGMRFNAKKCYILSIENKSQRYYNLSGHILQQVQNNPYLGLQISDDLKWTKHITNVTKKANSTLGFLRRNHNLILPQRLPMPVSVNKSDLFISSLNFKTKTFGLLHIFLGKNLALAFF
jgi:hypothetical protein